jgi:hypothetical protein
VEDLPSTVFTQTDELAGSSRSGVWAEPSSLLAFSVSSPERWIIGEARRSNNFAWDWYDVYHYQGDHLLEFYLHLPWESRLIASARGTQVVNGSDYSESSSGTLISYFATAVAPSKRYGVVVYTRCPMGKATPVSIILNVISRWHWEGAWKINWGYLGAEEVGFFSDYDLGAPGFYANIDQYFTYREAQPLAEHTTVLFVDFERQKATDITDRTLLTEEVSFYYPLIVR